MYSETDLKRAHAHTISFVTGLYDEVSKLSSKRPNDSVSSLTVAQANRAIRDTKELLSNEGDPYVGDITEFVSAGDDPENRDVVLVLRQLKEALERMYDRHRRSWVGY